MVGPTTHSWSTMSSKRWATTTPPTTSARPSTDATKVTAAPTRSGRRSAPTLPRSKATTPTSSSTGPFALACMSAALLTPATTSVLGLLQASSSEPSCTWIWSSKASSAEAMLRSPSGRLRRQACPTLRLRRGVPSGHRERVRAAPRRPQSGHPQLRPSLAARCPRLPHLHLLLHLLQLQCPQQPLHLQHSLSWEWALRNRA
jgi:hypothetical protein